jgi:hypothetical protein
LYSSIVQIGPPPFAKYFFLAKFFLGILEKGDLSEQKKILAGKINFANEGFWTILEYKT